MNRRRYPIAPRAYRTAQYTTAAGAAVVAMFASCAFAAGPWGVIQWGALGIVICAGGLIVLWEREKRATEARRWTPPPRPVPSTRRPVQARPVTATREAHRR
jgi:hypothetical protein